MNSLAITAILYPRSDHGYNISLVFLLLPVLKAREVWCTHAPSHKSVHNRRGITITCNLNCKTKHIRIEHNFFSGCLVFGERNSVNLELENVCSIAVHQMKRKLWPSFMWHWRVAYDQFFMDFIFDNNLPSNLIVSSKWCDFKSVQCCCIGKLQLF